LNRRAGVSREPTPRDNPLLIVFSGYSGVGKDAVLARLRELGRPFHYVVTATTRPMRAGEVEGADYHFVSRDEFQRMVASDELLEWATVYGNQYGVPRSEVSRALSKGVDVIAKVDVQGAATIKSILPQAVFIFLMPPSMRELERRLRERRSESWGDMSLRLRKVQEERESLPIFDYAITSYQDRLDDVVAAIDAIVVAERCRVTPRNVRL